MEWFARQDEDVRIAFDYAMWIKQRTLEPDLANYKMSTVLFYFHFVVFKKVSLCCKLFN